MEEEKKHKKLKGWQIVLIVMGALMEFLALLASIENRDPEMFLACTFMLGFLGGIARTIVNAVKRRKVANPLIVTAVCFCAFIAAALIFSGGETPPEQPGKPAVEEPTKVEEPKQSDEEKPCEHKWVLVDSVAATEESEGYEEYKCESCGETEKKTLEKIVLSETEYKALCKQVDYRELCRNPEKYIGEKVTVTVAVRQIVDAELFSNKKAWRAYSDTDGYGVYFDDEYYMLDERGDGSGKIIDDDIVVVYGEFTGVTNVTRALTWTSDELPEISVRYADIIGEAP